MLISDEIAAFVRWLCVFWGLVYLITQSVIFRVVRMVFLRYATGFGQMLYCPSCAGFWLGLLLGHWLWPWSHGWQQMAESGAAALALGAVWGAKFGSREVLPYEMALIKSYVEMRIADTDVSEGKL